jgi:hypothetical protein
MNCPACDHPNAEGARFCAKCGALLPPPRVEGADPLIGQVVGGRFRVINLLGEGGMGRVYTAEQQMGTAIRKVALKTLLQELSQDPQVVARFNRECGTVVGLEHPNTIKFYDFGQTNSGELYIAMEFVDGKALADEIAARPIPPERTDRIMKQICGSLQEAHSKGVIHRDLKPDNIILTDRAGENDFVKVLDFGIAKRAEATDSAKEQKLTQAGMVLGTPPYMSPEQFTGKPIDARSDIYALGVIAYEMLTSKLPFEANTPWEWATQHMTSKPFPFEQTTSMAAHIPPRMKQAIMRALSKEPSQRQLTAKQFCDELTMGLDAPVRASGGAATEAFSTNMMPGADMGRAGATQIGEPFVPPMDAPARGMTGAAPAMTPGPFGAPSPMGGPAGPMVPTGGGQAVPAPPMAMSRGGGNKGPLIALAGLVAVGLVVVLVLVLRGKKGGDEETGSLLPASSGTETSATDTSKTTTSPTTTETAATTKADAGGTPPTDSTSKVPTTTTATKTSTEKTPTQYCEEAIGAAMGGNCGAARAVMGKCAGAKAGTARANVDKFCKPGRRK